jgi:uncharacterized membrane protein YkvA (DUF1232 family)
LTNRQPQTKVGMGKDERSRMEKLPFLQKLKEKGQQIKLEIHALLLAYRNPCTPWYAKVWAALVIAYALSPIDLVPDFIPVIGYLDDLVLVPAGIAVAVYMIPLEVMQEAREETYRVSTAQPGNTSEKKYSWGIVLVISIWLVLLAIIGYLVFRLVD